MKKVDRNTSSFEIRHFDNKSNQLLLRSNELVINEGTKFSHELIDQNINNFYEFYIDGIMLIKHIWKEDGYLGFLESNNGMLGVYSKVNDELLINSLLGNEISKNALIEIYKKSNVQLNKERIELILNDYNNSNVLIYGCRICGDRDCGGIWINVYRDEKVITWKIGKEYEYTFEIEQYTNAFNMFLKNWKLA